MKRFKFTPVTISREEYDDYIKARFLVQHLLQSIEFDGEKMLPYTRIKNSVIESYFPEEVEKIRRKDYENRI